jgi:RimJ/RimL family protein N-acetyltransferase
MGYPCETPAEPSAYPRVFGFVPIRSLSARHKPRIIAHLLALDASDRYLRFGYSATDAQIERYVEQIDFDRDEVFGVFNRRLDLVALAHLAYERLPNDDQPASAGGTEPSAAHAAPHVGSAEFGVSVALRNRGRGYGARLFDHAVLRARNRGVETIVIHALSENVAMLRIVRNAGATVEHSGCDSEARLTLPPEDHESIVEAMVEAQVGELDYQFKQGARLAEKMMDVLARDRRDGHPPHAR